MQIMALWLLIRPRTLWLTLGVVLAAHTLAAAVSGVALLLVCLHGWRDWLVFLLLGALAIAAALA